MKRTIIVGDIHGCFDELLALLAKCGFKESDDRLIFVGDLINKGPYSFEVANFVRKGKFEVTVGNHELKFMDLLKKGEVHESSSFYLLYKKIESDLDQWLEYFSSMPGYVDENEFLVVHAGLRPDLPIVKTKVYELSNIRTWDGVGIDLQNANNPPWYEFYNGSKLVVYGHWARQGLTIRKNTIGLDSGCVYGQELSALILPERNIVQVKANKVYQSPKL